jgi:hypothetical protein
MTIRFSLSSFIYLMPCHQKCLCGSLLNVDDPTTQTGLMGLIRTSKDNIGRLKDI